MIHSFHSTKKACTVCVVAVATAAAIVLIFVGDRSGGGPDTWIHQNIMHTHAFSMTYHRTIYKQYNHQYYHSTAIAATTKATAPAIPHQNTAATFQNAIFFTDEQWNQSIIRRHPQARRCCTKNKLFLVGIGTNCDTGTIRMNDDDDVDNNNVDGLNDSMISSSQRRTLLSLATLLISTPTGVKAAAAAAVSSTSDDRLFRPNPLLNPILEQIRIWEQAEADNIRYGGELEMGNAGNKGKIDAYPKLLVPILQISYDIEQINSLIQQYNNKGNEQQQQEQQQEQQQLQLLIDARNIIKKDVYQKIPFKRIFNAYADNIYYSDPDRANLYLAGGATPKTEQSVAYLLRNEILTNIENIQSELEYIISNYPLESIDDLQKYVIDANHAMKQYIQIVSPQELEQAKKIINQ